MLYRLVLSGLILFSAGQAKQKDKFSDEADFGGSVINQMRNDANLDLSVDEEYEDLRAELLAYHTALATLSGRRSLKSTPCWELGGICVDHKLCPPGFRYLTEVPGCKDRLNVCCFTWNQFELRDMKDKGIGNINFPWSLQYDFGGKGVVSKEVDKAKKRKKKPKKKTETRALAFVITDK